MKVAYRGFEIDVHKDKCLGGWQLSYYSVFGGGLEIWSGFSESNDRVQTQIKEWKSTIDQMIANPTDYLESQDDIEFLQSKGLLKEGI